MAKRTSSRYLNSESLDIFQRIIDLGDDEEKDNFPIHDAVCLKGEADNQPLSIVEDALRAHPRSVNLLDSMNQTPMHLAVYFDDVDAVSLLLAWGGDPDIPGMRGATPLNCALRLEAAKCAKLMIQSGADVNKLNNAGYSCLDYSTIAGSLPVELTEVLISHGANLTSQHSNPLHRLPLACTSPEETALVTEKLQVLLNAGLHVDEPNRLGLSPLLTAVEYDEPGIVKALLEHGANTNFVTPDRRGLLHFAAQYARKDTLEVLHAHAQLEGLDPGLRSSEGKTAAEYFAERLDPKLPEGIKSTLTPAGEGDVKVWNNLLEMLKGGT